MGYWKMSAWLHYDCVYETLQKKEQWALYVYRESTKQMAQTLRAKVKIFFKSEN